MQLFQKLLIAPAALGLLAPLSANASEVTMNDFVKKDKLAITNSRIDGLEARLNDFEAGSFSDTTTLTGQASMGIGAVSDSLQIKSGVAFAMPDDEDEGIFFNDQTAVGAEATFKF